MGVLIYFCLSKHTYLVGAWVRGWVISNLALSE